MGVASFSLEDFLNSLVKVLVPVRKSLIGCGVASTFQATGNPSNWIWSIAQTAPNPHHKLKICTKYLNLCQVLKICTNYWKSSTEFEVFIKYLRFSPYVTGFWTNLLVSDLLKRFWWDLVFGRFASIWWFLNKLIDPNQVCYTFQSLKSRKIQARKNSPMIRHDFSTWLVLPIVRYP